MNHPTHSLRSKDGGKRGRMDDNVTAATKLRKSAASSSTSSAISCSTAPIVIATGPQGKVLAHHLPSAVSSSIGVVSTASSTLFCSSLAGNSDVSGIAAACLIPPNQPQARGIRLKPAIRAKQTQLFGERIHNPTTTQQPLLSTNVVKTKQSCTVATTKAIDSKQQTLTGAASRVSRRAQNDCSRPPLLTGRGGSNRTLKGGVKSTGRNEVDQENDRLAQSADDRSRQLCCNNVVGSNVNQRVNNKSKKEMKKTRDDSIMNDEVDGDAVGQGTLRQDDHDNNAVDMLLPTDTLLDRCNWKDVNTKKTASIVQHEPKQLKVGIRNQSYKVVTRTFAAATAAAAAGSTTSLSTLTTATSVASAFTGGLSTSKPFNKVFKAFDNGLHPCLDDDNENGVKVNPDLCETDTPKANGRSSGDDPMCSLDDDNNDDSADSERAISSVIILLSDRQLLQSKVINTSLKGDSAAYGHDWVLHHKHREDLFQPWQMTLSGKMEKMHLGVIAMYWESAKRHRCSLATIHVAINNLSRVLTTWSPAELDHPSPAKWALTAVIAYRLAFKMEERPEVLWEVSSFWDMFPMFADWTIDRSDENMNKMEMAALHTLKDSMDAPLATMFLSLYLNAGGWPDIITRDYQDLACYLLALSTFTSARDQLLKNVPPSTMAAAALVLAIKIINGDRALSSGMLPHLQACERKKVPAAAAMGAIGNVPSECTCRYEFFPERLEIYSKLNLTDLQPVIRGLSCLLRSKAEEAHVLKHFFPVWGEIDWQ